MGGILALGAGAVATQGTSAAMGNAPIAITFDNPSSVFQTFGDITAFGPCVGGIKIKLNNNVYLIPLYNNM